VKRLKYVRPPLGAFQLKKSPLEIVEQSSDANIQEPEKNRSRHIGNSKKPQNYYMHWPKLHRRRSGQKNAKDNQVMVKAGDPLLCNHVEMLPCPVVLLDCRHIKLFSHNKPDQERKSPASNGSKFNNQNEL
jgi:hypothetical protein